LIEKGFEKDDIFARTGLAFPFLIVQKSDQRRGGRVVEGARLESV
jgi:hypothetical protein